MNKGNQKKTTEKYINYIIDLIKTHNLNHLGEINIKDGDLLKKYFKGSDATVSSAYSYMVKKLISLGILEDIHSRYIPKRITKRYSINIGTLMNYCDELEIPLTFIFPDEEERIISLNTLSSTTIPIPYNHIKVEDSQLISKVDKLGVDDLEPLKFKNRADNIIDDISNYYGTKIRYTNKVLLECYKLIDWINEHQSLTEYNMPLHGYISSKKVLTTIRVSARQYSTYATDRKVDRIPKLERLGIDSEFDLHSAIFAVTKLLNTGEFDIDWDLKREIFPNYDTMSNGEKLWVKNLLNRCFFTKTSGQAWSKYNWKYKGTPISLTREEFTNIYDAVQESISGSTPYIYNIFLYESLFELLILKYLISKGYDVVNVYDCFYYKSSQLTEKEIKEVITQIAIDFNDFLFSL